MDSGRHIIVPLRSGGKKMRKRRELDALIAHSLAKKDACRRLNSNVYSQDKLLSVSTDDPEEYTWGQVKASHSVSRSHKRKHIFFCICKPVLYVVGIMLFFGLIYWLYLDLRQQIYDYRQKIEEVSATSQNLPDTLQKWHEMSTSLLKNQTILLLKINNLQRSTDMLHSNFTEYKTSIDAQLSYAKNDKIVADFGAKIESVVTDIEGIKERYDAIVGKQNKLQDDLMQLKANLRPEQPPETTTVMNIKTESNTTSAPP